MREAEWGANMEMDAESEFYEVRVVPSGVARLLRAVNLAAAKTGYGRPFEGAEFDPVGMPVSDSSGPLSTSVIIEEAAAWLDFLAGEVTLLEEIVDEGDPQ